MLNFTIHTTTEVVFGRNIEEQIGPKLKEIGAHRILVHFGGSSARSSGLLDRVEKSLFDAGLSFIELGGVSPNPKVSMVRKGIALCQREGIDFILAVGGGSVIDSAKGIGMGVATGRDPWEFAATEHRAGQDPARCDRADARGLRLGDQQLLRAHQRGNQGKARHHQPDQPPAHQLPRIRRTRSRSPNSRPAAALWTS